MKKIFPFFLLLFMSVNCIGAINLIISGGIVPNSMYQGATYNITIYVQNTGSSSTTTTFYVSIFLSPTSTFNSGTAHYLTDITVNGIGANTTKTLTTTITVPCTYPSGIKYIIAGADGTDLVPETSNSDNNLPFGVLVQSLPDLTPLNYSLSSNSTNAGNSITANFAVNNNGGLAAGSFTAGFYLSSSSTLNIPPAILLGTYSVGSVSACGQTTLLGKTLTIPSSTCTGSYYLHIWIDNGTAIAEVDNNNNFQNKPISITGATLNSPSANAATNFTQTSFQANWSSLSNASGYRLDVSLNNSFSSFISGYNNLDIGNNLSKSVTGLVCNTNYYYRIRAYNSCGNSNGYSSTITAPTSTCACTNPDAPVLDPPFVFSSDEIDLNWNDVPGATSYDVYYTTGVCPWNNGNLYTTRNFSDVQITGLSPATTYKFVIVAKSSSGCASGNSNCRSATTQPIIPNTYSISGTIIYNSNGLGGVILNATPGNYTASTNSSGNYVFTLPSGWSGTITPSLTNYTFSPPNLPYSNLSINTPGQNYTATLIPAPASLISFYNKIDNNQAFTVPKLMVSALTNNITTPFKVCADGSQATFIEYQNNDPSVQLNNIYFRIAQDINGNQPLVYGSFTGTFNVNSNVRKVYFNHPTYMDHSGPYRAASIQVIDAGNLNAVLATYPMEIYRAPVLFVHGLWGDGSAFRELAADLTSNSPFQHYPSQSGFIDENGINTYSYPLFKLVDYYSSNGLSFKANRQVISTNINYLFSIARIHNYSCGKTIVVAHSMGGVLTRLYVNSTWANSTLYRNDIQKIITLNSPHYGSQMADMALHILNNYGPGPLIVAGFINTFHPGNFNGLEAIKDLSVSSNEIIKYLNGVNSQPNVVPHHEITTSKVFGPSSEQRESAINNLVNSCGNPFPGLHDEVVDIRSQRSDLTGITWQNTSSDQFHMGSTRNPLVKAEVIQLIDKDPNSSLFSNAPYHIGAIPEPSFNCGLFSVNVINSNDSINVIEPTQNATYNADDSISFKFTGTSNVNKIYVFIGVNDSTIRIIDTTFSNELLVKLKLQSNNYGKLYVGAIGYNDQTIIAYDSSSFYLSPVLAADSFYIDKDVLIINKGHYDHVNFNAIFSDGINRNLNTFNLNIENYDTSKISYFGNGFFYGKEICDTFVKVNFQNKVDSLRIIVTDLPQNDIASFTYDKNTICKGESINFTNESLGAITQLHWEFPGGNPSSSTLSNPVVTYNTEGVYKVTLVTTFSNQTDTLSIDNLIEVNAPNKTIGSGDWDNPTTWRCGIVPSLNDSVIIAASHNVTLNTSTQIRKLYVENSGAVSINDSSVVFTIGNETNKISPVIFDGSMNIANGIIKINGNLEMTNTSQFNMTGGKLIIDGNTGDPSTSIPDGQHLFSVFTPAENFNFSGGSLQFPNPPLGTNSQTISCSNDFSAASTLILGDANSTIASNNQNGFGGNLLPNQIGKLIFDPGTSPNNRVFVNLNPLVVRTRCEVRSGNFMQSALLQLLDSTSIIDFDGNIYPVVNICNQTWTTKNLEVTHYRNGDSIPQIQDPTVWSSLTTGAWCYYENSTANGTVYGKLYNWYAVNDPRGLAPLGWHIPSNEEWIRLADSCLGGAAIAANKMKTTGTIQAGSGLWGGNFNTSTNSSGFSGLPAGYCFINGTFSFINSAVFWWSSTPKSSTNAWFREADQEIDDLSVYDYSKKIGISVRCVKD